MYITSVHYLSKEANYFLCNTMYVIVFYFNGVIHYT
jgi:hypothetical protein